MALGTIRAQALTRPLSQSQASPQAFGAGVAQAVQTLAGAVGDYDNSRRSLMVALGERAQRQESFDVQRRFVEHQAQVAQYYATRTRESTENVSGFTDSISGELSQMNDEFLQTVPQHLRGQYEVQLAELQAQRNLEAFNFEYNQGNEFFRVGVQDVMNQTTSALQAGEIPFDQAVVQVHDLIAASDLPELEKQNLYRDTSQVLASIQFRTEVTAAAMTNAPVGEANGSDVVAPGLLPAERAALNAISGPESGGRYNVRYGGADGTQTFDSYDDHPRIVATRPDGRTSSAAGRYQFLASTWDRAVAMFNVQNPDNPVRDFTPVSQDRVAAFWVAYQFNIRNDRNLDFHQVINSGNPADIAYIRQVLVSEWEGLGEMEDEEWVALVSSMAAEGGSGTAEGPDLWTDPRFADIPYDAKLQLANQASAAIEAQRTAQAEAAENARQQQLDSMNRQAYHAEVGEELISEAWENGTFRTVEEEQTFRRNLAEGRELQRSVLEAKGALASGGPVTRVSGGAGLDDIIGDQVREALYNNDGTAGARVAQLSTTAGFIPPATQAVFSRMLSGADMDNRAFALGVLASMPDRLLNASGLSADEVADVAYFRDNAQFFDGNPAGQRELLTQLDTIRGGMGSEQSRQFRDRAIEAFDENYLTPQSLTPIFDGYFTTLPEPPPAQSGAGVAFMSDARAAYIQGYQRFGTEEGAQTYMETFMQQTWGPTDVGGGSTYLVKHPPEITYSGMTLNGDLSWMDTQVRQDFALPLDSTFQLVAEPETLADIQAGLPNPRYGVVVTDAQGIAHYMPDLYQGQHTPEVQDQARHDQQRIFADARVAEMQYARDRAEQVVRDMVYQDRPQSEVEAAQAAYEETVLNLRNAEAARAEVAGPGMGPAVAPESVNALLPTITGEQNAEAGDGPSMTQPGVRWQYEGLRVRQDTPVNEPPAGDPIASPSATRESDPVADISTVEPSVQAQRNYVAEKLPELLGSRNAIVREVLSTIENGASKLETRTALTRAYQEVSNLPASEGKNKLLENLTALIEEFR